MLSTLTIAIISIFIEVFATGILFAGSYSFLKSYVTDRERKNLQLSALFFFFGINVALAIVSQMMYNLGSYNLGRSEWISRQELIERFIYLDIMACSLFIWLFNREKFGWGGAMLSRVLSVAMYIALPVVGYFIFTKNINLAYLSGVIEPKVSFSVWLPPKSIWPIMWALLSLLAFWNSIKAPLPRKNLLFLSGFSSLLVVVAYICMGFYVARAGDPFLFASCIVTMFGAVGLLIAEIIPSGSRLAAEPLNLFRSRILYKLILIFVVLIVILLETTTIVTINISRASLKNAIDLHQQSIAEGIADKINYIGIDRHGKPDFGLINMIVIQAKQGERTVYVVDGSGKLVAYFQRNQIGADLHAVISVASVLRGESGTKDYESIWTFLSGEFVVGSYAPVKGAKLGVIVEEPEEYVYKEIRKVETNSLIFVIAGIILTVFVGIFFARSIERPIKEVMEGTEAVRRGNLNYRITVGSLDEIGQLASAFNKMTSELKETQDALVKAEKLAALGTMAAGMAHEIKNPLVSLRTFTQLLQQKFDDPEYRRKFSAIVPQEIERINKIAESLLKFGRPSKPELTRVNVNKTLEEVLELMENECKSNNIRVTTKFVPGSEITGDPMQLSQAFVNIILNAIQAMPQGGELTVKTDVGEVIRLAKGMRKGILKREEAAFGERVWGEEEEGQKETVSERPVPVVFVEITDTGVGISEESLKSLFDPFFTTKAGGTGMGLPITLRIIEDHKGSIKVKSLAGKGTTFIVTLPQRLDEV